MEYIKLHRLPIGFILDNPQTYILDGKDTERFDAKRKSFFNGIYYYGIKDAAKSMNINSNTLLARLSGRLKNNTPFVYA